MSPSDLDKVIDAARQVPAAEYPGGWPDEIEAALLDAVLSIQARYGTPTTGVRACIARYRDHHRGRHLDDLTVLAGHTADDLQEIIDNKQQVSGRPKAAVVVEAAARLVDAGVQHAADLDPANAGHKRAYTSVHGLGPITWEYFGMCLDKPGVKADTWIIRFVEDAVDHPVTAERANSLLLEVARHLERDPTRLDYDVWYYMRSREDGEGLAT